MSNRENAAQTTKPACIACGTPITVGASICSVCKSYQRSWRNLLQYTAGITTLFVVSLSACVWSYQRTRMIFFYRDDIRVVACESLRSAVFVNRGDGDVFVTRLAMWMPGRTQDWVAPTLDVNQPLAPGQFLKKDFPPSKFQDAAYFIRGLGPPDFEKVLASAANNDPCLELDFFSEADTLYEDIRRMAGPTLNTFVVQGRFEYQDAKRDTAQQELFAGVGLVRRHSTPECRPNVKDW